LLRWSIEKVDPSKQESETLGGVELFLFPLAFLPPYPLLSISLFPRPSFPSCILSLALLFLDSGEDVVFEQVALSKKE
jgi:hypothetical protein